MQGYTIHVAHPFIFPVQRIPLSYQGAAVQKGMQGSRSDVPIDHPDYFPPASDGSMTTGELEVVS